MDKNEKIRVIIEASGAESITDKNDLIEALENEPEVSVRLNPFKSSAAFSTEETVPWCSQGRYLKERPVFAFDPLWHAGAYYVQEASSMFTGSLFSLLTREAGPLKVLDLCAAPGGKSTHLLSELKDNDILVSNEINKGRVLPLSDNIQRWGKANVVICSGKASDMQKAGEYFDFIIADMPCSGEGMVRKDPFALEQWNEGLVKQCAALQKELLQEAWKALKPGGIFIYSTCTFNTSENEENIRYAAEELGATAIEIPDPGHGITTTESAGIRCFRFFPHQLKGEGFFIAAFTKPGDTQIHNDSRRKKSKENTEAPGWLRGICNSDYKAALWKGLYYLQPGMLAEEINYLTQKLPVISPGCRAGQVAGKDFVPDHALALLSGISQHVQTFEVNEEDAINFLRKEPVNSVAACDIQEKWALITYQNQGLGWIKKAGENRINNYYPLPLRIRKQR